VYLSSYGSSSANLAVETDVVRNVCPFRILVIVTHIFPVQWTIDATVQRITVQWVNPDGCPFY